MNDRLFKENLQALKGYLPKDLVKAFKHGAPSRVRLTGKIEDGSLNAEAGGQALYQPDAMTFAALQVEQFCNEPNRLMLPLTRWDYENPKDFSHVRLPRQLLSQMQGIEISRHMSGDGAYMICIGLGLGIHIPQLIDKLGFRHLLIVESDPELIYWSMHILPWVRMISTLKQRGGDLTIGAAGDPAQTAGQLIGSLRGSDFALVDGSYLFQHYQTPAADALASAIHEALPILHGTVGFFEDECLMLKHALLNTERVSHRQLLPKNKCAPAPMPAFVVGSGPSLDQSLDQISRNQGNAVIFGAGTGTSALLKNGIKPQFHCEIENDPNYATILSQDATINDYRGITFIAPYIVDPKLPPIFDEVVFYFRELLIPTRLMARPVDVLPFSTPSVSNLACRAAAAMGFSEIYLFGVDLGSRQASRQHAADSLYSRNEDWMALSPLIQPVEANFGGLAYTNKQFLAARATFQQFLAGTDTGRVLNCSDGIQILGTEPLRSEEISLSTPDTTPAQCARSLLDPLPRKAAVGEIQGKEFTKYFSETTQRFEKIRTILCEAKGIAPLPEDPVTVLHDRLKPFIVGGHLDPAHTVDASVRTTFTGTIIAALQFGRFFEARMSVDQKFDFFTKFVDALDAELTELQHQFQTLFAAE